MRTCSLFLAIFVFMGFGSSFAWEILSDVPDSLDVGQSFVLEARTWLPNAECYACRGQEVIYGEFAADVFLITERTQPWDYDCNGFEVGCYYVIEIAFQEPGVHVLRLFHRFIAPAFGGEFLIQEYTIEVAAPVSNSCVTWSAMKAAYR